MPTNPHHTEYAPPVLRAPSPASSIGTVYGEDQTAFSDCEDELSQYDFERKVEERIALNVPRFEELQANHEPLLARPTPGSIEERYLYERIMTSLRLVVRDLEDNELFERTLLKGSQAALEQQPSTNDIDALMRSMMVAPTPQSSINGIASGRGRSDSRVTSGPWAVNGNGKGVEHDESLLTTGVTPGKRSRNGSRRN
ncbi:hypothetical protein DXG03_004585 [Asterophora parasitica]|uniref:Uncharacterized protein n=1 Tax=Asterophora parasitica TaxID=117018 RepID=A0A9P7G8R9_9AGAR|nr:hypothetical protein DXG03_004585 [Asterophora parasitica]